MKKPLFPYNLGQFCLFCVSQAFTIKTKSNVNINFVAPSAQEQNMWTDGIKCLLKVYQNEQRQQMSHIFENDVKSLVHLRMRVRLIPFKEAEDQSSKKLQFFIVVFLENSEYFLNFAKSSKKFGRIFKFSRIF